MTSPAQMLFGAALVVLGVLAAALADRLRGDHVRRRVAIPRARVGRPQDLNLNRERAPRDALNSLNANGATDVIAALTAAGYKKSAAAAATLSCGVNERLTVEDWTRAALRRCANGAT
jgi:hypothetical protein